MIITVDVKAGKFVTRRFHFYIRDEAYCQLLLKQGGLTGSNILQLFRDCGQYTEESVYPIESLIHSSYGGSF